jgi:hypothetical protein
VYEARLSSGQRAQDGRIASDNIVIYKGQFWQEGTVDNLPAGRQTFVLYDYLSTSFTGQWSEPMTWGRIEASLALLRKVGETKR